MSRKIIGYKCADSIKYVISDEDRNIISSHIRSSYMVENQIGEYGGLMISVDERNSGVRKGNECGFLSDERMHQIGAMILSL